MQNEPLIRVRAIRWTNLDGEAGVTLLDENANITEIMRDLATNEGYVTWHYTYVTVMEMP